MNVVRMGVLLAALPVALSALNGCSKNEPTTKVAPAAKTQPPPVIPPLPKQPPAYFRDHYAKLEDCVYDWGYPQKCTPVAPGTPVQQAGANFLGPIYVRTYRDETQVQLRKEAVEGGYVQRTPTDTSDRSIARSEVKS